MNLTKDKLLTIDFQKSHSTLVESGDQESFLKRMNNCKKLFFNTKVKYNEPWEELDKSFKYRKYHSITINMDPSKIGYENNINYQRSLLYPIIDRFRNKIKYLTIVYEYGSGITVGSGKLHWHMLINIQSVKEFQEALETEFGKKRAVRVRKVEPNNKETLEDNLLRILEYFRKEEHNKKSCLLHICK